MSKSKLDGSPTACPFPPFIFAPGDTDIFAQVHENFRCVVLQDADQLHLADAAFLNRFEKHYVAWTRKTRGRVRPG